MIPELSEPHELLRRQLADMVGMRQFDQERSGIWLHPHPPIGPPPHADVHRQDKLSVRDSPPRTETRETD